ncbi:MAG: hypothetical protein CMH53_05290, partial [Myxococcales bacterium]|nr:hypothetical protein [Myxococcales bacterium]
MPPVLVIVNPASSAGRTAGRWRVLEPQVRAQLGADVEVAITQGPGEATELVRKALSDRPRRVVSVGGDGTHHEVINGFFPSQSKKPIAPEARFSFISSGTGSDLARSFESQSDLQTLLSKIAADDARPLDLIGCHYTRDDQSSAFEICINIGSVGLGGWVTRKVDSRSKGLLPAQLLFFLTSVEGLFRTPSYDIRFCLDEGQWQRVLARNLVTANARFQGGGMEIAPDADPHD